MTVVAIFEPFVFTLTVFVAIVLLLEVVAAAVEVAVPDKFVVDVIE